MKRLPEISRHIHSIIVPRYINTYISFQLSVIVHGNKIAQHHQLVMTAPDT